MATLTKARVIKSISEKTGFLRADSSDIVETLLELIKSELESGEDVLISGFGKFCVNEKGERRGRNPATDSEMMLRARKVVTFRCSQRLRDRINGK